ncbi:MAG: calcium-binding protein, partial [Gammaproteobacteria bacterium]
LDFSGTTLLNIAAIEGRGGNDTLIGSVGADTLVGGKGNDRLQGGMGDDLFLYNDGDGYDRVSGGDGTDTLQGGAADDAIGLVRFSGSDTVEVIDGGAGYNVIRNNDYSNTLDFSGTTLLNIAAIEGRGGNDTLIGSVGDDVLDGGAGNDRLVGAAGSDTYRFGRGYGRDTIDDCDAQHAQSEVYGETEDRVLFGADIVADQLWFSRTGDDLLVDVIGTGDRLAVAQWYAGATNRVDRFTTADGAYLLDSQVEQLVSAMAAFAPPAMGETALPPVLQDELQPVIAAAWQSVA